MLNAFPQGNQNPDLLLRTFEAAVREINPEAVLITAELFTTGQVDGQSAKFAPSVAEFTVEARRQEKLLPYRGRVSIPRPKWEQSWKPQPKEHRIRMGFKMTLLSMGLARRDVEAVKKANDAGLEELMALAQTWGVPIPEELWAEIGKAA
jgi:hypothetical protein